MGAGVRAVLATQQLRASSTVISKAERENSWWRSFRILPAALWEAPSHTCIRPFVCVLRMEVMKNKKTPEWTLEPSTALYGLKGIFLNMFLFLILTATLSCGQERCSRPSYLGSGWLAQGWAQVKGQSWPHAGPSDSVQCSLQPLSAVRLTEWFVHRRE